MEREEVMTTLKKRKSVKELLNYDGYRSEKLREHQYREGYTRSLGGKRVEWDGENNVEHIREQVKLQWLKV